ncbi:thioredoxin-dependent thiol peroxidase [Parapedomonas caeni]|jgi:peroxiredoxin Q/BCP
MSDLAIGQPAPAFTLPLDDGRTVSLADFRGRAVVLYFYPKDDTPGCTTEARDFSAHLDAFTAAGAVVIGVSKDTQAKHNRFRAKHGLSILLGTDEDGQVLEAYGSWVEKSLYGRQYMGIDRSTFLIDGEGVLRQVWRKVKVAGHAEAVLKAVRTL